MHETGAHCFKTYGFGIYSNGNPKQFGFGFWVGSETLGWVRAKSTFGFRWVPLGSGCVAWVCINYTIGGQVGARRSQLARDSCAMLKDIWFWYRFQQEPKKKCGWVLSGFVWSRRHAYGSAPITDNFGVQFGPSPFSGMLRREWPFTFP